MCNVKGGCEALIFFNAARWRSYRPSQHHLLLQTSNPCDPSFCRSLSGDPTGSDPAPSRSRSRPREGGARARLIARRPRQGPEPRHDGAWRGREPHGGGPQTQGPGYSGGQSGGEGGAAAALCGENCWDFIFRMNNSAADPDFNF